MELKVGGGGQATLHVLPLADRSCKRIVVHLGGWAAKDTAAVETLDPAAEHTMTIPITR